MDNQFKAFLDDLRATHRDNLVSVILYGSAAAGDFVAKASDYNLLIALEHITPADLRAAHACMREWARLGHPIPVYFTASELENAADVFPIEFHQMARVRKVLYGRDVLAGLEISNEHLRHQTEYELRSKLIRLRRQYITVSTSIEGMTHLMAESLATFASVFRAVLMINGIEPPLTKQEVAAATAAHLGIDGKPFEKIFNIRKNNFAPKLDEATANQLFTDYMEQIERVIAAVDEKS